MIINKDQSQSVKEMGINLGEKYFSHGHLYVASSKGGSAKGN
jgi:hypothetical protein